MLVKSARKIAPVMVNVFLVFICSVIWAQPTQTTPPSANHNSGDFSKAENKWRLAPVDFQSQNDSAPPDLRAARDAYWRPILQHDRDLEAEGKWTAKPGGPPSMLEIAANPDATWVVATFDHHLVVSIDPDFNLLYTEISFKINEVIKQPEALLSPGMSFDVDVEGGALKTPRGDIVSWHVSPHRYFVQHGHAYIMEIRPHQAGHFYYISKLWDVTTGRVVPDHEDEVTRATEGRSKLNGMATRDAISHIQSVLGPK